MGFRMQFEKFKSLLKQLKFELKYDNIPVWYADNTSISDNLAMYCAFDGL
jgi:hypothetical protein